MNQLPKLIQGGMGVGISSPHLARVCATIPGVLGTVSGVAAERILALNLKRGNPDYLRALEHFPFPDVAERIIARYYVPGGEDISTRRVAVSMFSMKSRADLIELAVAGAFCAVWLAKEGHDGEVSFNLLEKLQIPHLFLLTGAILAGVDWVTMGAGITTQIPGVLQAVASGGSPSYRISVDGREGGVATLNFDPTTFFGRPLPPMRRPRFLPIISSNMLAAYMKKTVGPDDIDGFVVELPEAGGHNAPPRVKGVVNEFGEVVYGDKDRVNFAKLTDLGIPFWIGGAYASPEGLARAKAQGAVGIQVGSIFALCDDSGMSDAHRCEIRRQGHLGTLSVVSSASASPTGYPFQVVQMAGTVSDPDVYEDRTRVCDIGGLRSPYQRGDGSIGYRCASEPIAHYVKKGGVAAPEARCLCNGLFAAVGLGNPGEPSILTLGKDTKFLRVLMSGPADRYTAADAIAYLLRT